MDNLFKKYLEFKLQDIKWGEIKVNFKNSYEKIFKAKEGDLSSNIFIKDNSLFTDLLFRGELGFAESYICLLYTSPSPRDRQKSRMPSSA